MTSRSPSPHADDDDDTAQISMFVRRLAVSKGQQAAAAGMHAAARLQLLLASSHIAQHVQPVQARTLLRGLALCTQLALATSAGKMTG
jgi:hypothetical protein